MALPPLPPEGTGGSDPSMDDILASIRRILSDEEKAAKPAAPSENIFVLDQSMMVEDSGPVSPPAHTPPDAIEPRRDDLPASAATEPPAQRAAIPEPAPERPVPAAQEPVPNLPSLVAPEAAAAAASSVGALMRTLTAERGASVQRGGPTIEDVVREEIRPLLKQWLDAHLPTLVERLVRAEIERVVGRITS